MSSRVRVVTPELLDSAVASLVNTGGSATHGAVQTVGAGGGTIQATGVVTATPNTLVQRDAAGRTQFVSPSVSADAATKGYVDTQDGLLVPKTQLGAASGVATLDSNSLITTAQIPTGLTRYLGSGTALPNNTVARPGDRYYHTGVGCMFGYNGTVWRQEELPQASNSTARNAISTNYASALYPGFRVYQTDQGWTFEWLSTNKWSKVPGTPLALGTALSTSGLVAVGASAAGVINGVTVPTHQAGPIRFVSQGLVVMGAAGGNTAGYLQFALGTTVSTPDLGVFGIQHRFHNQAVTQSISVRLDETIYSDGAPKFIWILGWNDSTSSQSWYASNFNFEFFQV